MPAILVATDFSDTAFNACLYAAEMTIALNGKLILFNAWNAPEEISGLPVAYPLVAELEKDCIKQLSDVRERVRALVNTELQIDIEYQRGDANDKILSAARQKNAELIVMGMRGAGRLSELLIGSTTTSLMRNGEIPVLAVGEKAKFNSIKKIVLATDLKTVAAPLTSALKKITGSFHPHVFVLNVIAADKQLTTEQAASGVLLDHALEGLDHSFHFKESDNVTEAITNFGSNQNADLIAIIPSKQSLLWRALHQSNTKRLSFGSEIPVLSLPVN